MIARTFLGTFPFCACASPGWECSNVIFANHESPRLHQMQINALGENPEAIIRALNPSCLCQDLWKSLSAPGRETY